ncbi:MAG: hypothetical protein U5P10_07210 [Spirochaetia bacterium]|nr:hypothetical protein [Spirochaetia bacterium]
MYFEGIVGTLYLPQYIFNLLHIFFGFASASALYLPVLTNIIVTSGRACVEQKITAAYGYCNDKIWSILPCSIIE